MPQDTLRTPQDALRKKSDEGLLCGHSGCPDSLETLRHPEGSQEPSGHLKAVWVPDVHECVVLLKGRAP